MTNSLGIVKKELLSKDAVAQELFDNEKLLLAAIKNEFTLPVLIKGIKTDMEALKLKIKDIPEDDQDLKMKFVSELKQNSVQERQMQSALEVNKRNIEIYQEYLEYLKAL
jgi:hypothetical protein